MITSKTSKVTLGVNRQFEPVHLLLSCGPGVKSQHQRPPPDGTRLWFTTVSLAGGLSNGSLRAIEGCKISGEPGAVGSEIQSAESPMPGFTGPKSHFRIFLRETIKFHNNIFIFKNTERRGVTYNRSFTALFMVQVQRPSLSIQGPVTWDFWFTHVQRSAFLCPVVFHEVAYPINLTWTFHTFLSDSVFLVIGYGMLFLCYSMGLNHGPPSRT